MLLSVINKILCKIILNRISGEGYQILGKNQAGFRKRRSCSAKISALKQIVEPWVKCHCVLQLYRLPQSISRGIERTLRESLEDLDFADDTALFSQRHQDIQAKTNTMDSLGKQIGHQCHQDQTHEDQRKEWRGNHNQQHRHRRNRWICIPGQQGHQWWKLRGLWGDPLLLSFGLCKFHKSTWLHVKSKERFIKQKTFNWLKQIMEYNFHSQRSLCSLT